MHDNGEARKCQHVACLINMYKKQLKRYNYAMLEKVEKLASFVDGSSKTVVFTGAGISTESGIPDFRSPGGVWSRYKPVYYDEFMSSHDARKRYWAMKKEFFAGMKAAVPNAAHKAVAGLYEMGRLSGLITQNIDGLHQDAGVPEEFCIELHGTNRSVECQTCGARQPAEGVQARLEAGEEVPQCECGGWLKPATISFGQQLKQDDLSRAFALSSDCDLFIVIGSSLVVYPAASMPDAAVRSGAKLVIINRDETPFDSVAAIVVHETAGEFLPAVVEKLRTNERRTT